MKIKSKLKVSRFVWLVPQVIKYFTAKIHPDDDAPCPSLSFVPICIYFVNKEWNGRFMNFSIRVFGFGFYIELKTHYTRL